MHRIAIECIIASRRSRYFVKRLVRPMSFSPPPFVAAAIACTIAASMPDDAHAAADIGRATSITTSVTGTLDTQSIVLKTGDDVFASQTMTTDANGVGQFEFNDKTKLAIGPGSTVVLDDFVYNPKGSGSKIVLDLTRGSFRFITGKASHTAYEITTPTATIGVRGTAFDVYVGDTGEIAIAMINGAVQVCPRNGACRLHNIVGRFLHMSIDGVFSLHSKWDGTFFTGIPLKAALPFIDNQRLLVPALRGQTKIVARYVDGTAATVTKTVKTLKPPKLKAPKLTLPKLFK
jgi:hypothetical protein